MTVVDHIAIDEWVKRLNLAPTADVATIGIAAIDVLGNVRIESTCFTHSLTISAAVRHLRTSPDCECLAVLSVESIIREYRSKPAAPR
jgi:hypothetical protein